MFTDNADPVKLLALDSIDPVLTAILAAANQQRFEDVASNAYCYDAVNWAVERSITSGTGKYTFSPDNSSLARTL